MTYVDKRINTSVLDHLPGVLGSGNVRFAVQSNVAESVAVEEFESPFEDRQEAAENAEDHIADHAADTTVIHGLLARNGAQLAQELNDGDEQTSQADGTEAVGEGTLGGTASGVLREVVDAEVPGAVDTRNDGVDGVLQPFGNPVHCKGDEDHQTDNLGLAAAAPISATVGVVGRWLPLGVNSDHGDSEPSTEGSSEETTNQADEVDVAILLADSNAGLEHQGGEWNSRDPGVEGEGEESTKDEENNTGRVVLLVQVEDGGTNGENDVENSSHPDKRLREKARKPYITIGKHRGDTEDNGEEDDGVAVETESVETRTRDAAARVSANIALDGDSRDDGETSKGSEEL